MKYPLPYAYARENLLLLEQDGDQLILHWAGPGDADSEQEEATAMARLSALSEVMRRYAPRQLVSHPAMALTQRISAAYSDQTSGGSAAAVVSEVQSDADLSRMMQELPAVE
ncbi:MAG: type II secretion system protein GspE, partial [Burkholderiaceae bacterium]|nr:type II secretion system protein GspE [Burkholderiaceae bacterium]